MPAAIRARSLLFQALNLQSVRLDNLAGGHIELRAPDASLRLEIIQAQVAITRALVRLAVRQDELFLPPWPTSEPLDAWRAPPVRVDGWRIFDVVDSGAERDLRTLLDLVFDQPAERAQAMALFRLNDWAVEATGTMLPDLSLPAWTTRELDDLVETRYDVDRRLVGVWFRMRSQAGGVRRQIFELVEPPAGFVAVQFEAARGVGYAGDRRLDPVLLARYLAEILHLDGSYFLIACQGLLGPGSFAELLRDEAFRLNQARGITGLGVLAAPEIVWVDPDRPAADGGPGAGRRDRGWRSGGQQSPGTNPLPGRAADWQPSCTCRPTPPTRRCGPSRSTRRARSSSQTRSGYRCWPCRAYGQLAHVRGRRDVRHIVRAGRGSVRWRGGRWSVVCGCARWRGPGRGGASVAGRAFGRDRGGFPSSAGVVGVGRRRGGGRVPGRRGGGRSGRLGAGSRG